MLAPLRTATRTPAFTSAGFYGWRIVALAGFALGMTAPGQTVGISVFVDPLLGELSMTRSTLSSLYLVGTLTGAAALPLVGRLIDTWGVRRTMVTVGSAFGAALLGASQVRGLITLTFAFIALRMLGQGSLTLTASTSVAFWFERRRGTAVGIASATGQGLMSLAPLVLAAVIAAVGWRSAWALAGAAVLVVLVPVAAVFMRDRPSQLGHVTVSIYGSPGSSGVCAPSYLHVTVGSSGGTMDIVSEDEQTSDAASYQIGEVADRVGLSLRTVRYYEEVGLVVPSDRTSGGFRLYTDEDIARLELVKQMKPLGFTLDEMRDLLELREALRSDALRDGDRDVAAGRLAMYATAASVKVEELRDSLAAAERFVDVLRSETAEHATVGRRRR